MENTCGELDFQKYLNSGTTDSLGAMAKVMESESDNMKIQLEACKALAAAPLEHQGILKIAPQRASFLGNNRRMGCAGR